MHVQAHSPASTERQRAADALHLSGTLLEPPPAERASALQDELGGLLQTLKLDVSWLDQQLAQQQGRPPEYAQAMRERMRARCQTMGRMIESVMGGLGRSAIEVRPGILDRQGLWAALEWQAREFALNAELELDWDMQVPGAPDLSSSVALAAFRTFQDMLENVRRHARASRVAVRIVGDPERLRMTVEDNGIGAPADTFESPQARGIIAMRERARPFGGQVAISSEPGRGSAFTLVLPLVHR
jgi:signal transduction histidine kinase